MNRWRLFPLQEIAKPDQLAVFCDNARHYWRTFTPRHRQLFDQFEDWLERQISKRWFAKEI
jgi:hypothetical protein